MVVLFKIFIESISQAFQQLLGNKLRTFLSLLGITIGIWCVIMVLSAIDSMEYNIRNSFEKLGDDVIYVSQFSWEDDPSNNYWKWMRRPQPSYNDFKALHKNLNTADMVTFSSFLGGKNIEYQSSNVNGVFVVAVTADYIKMFNLEFQGGRFYSDTEYRLATPTVILGHKVAKELFGDVDPLNKRVKILGRKCHVIGVLNESGQDLINPLNFDNTVIISYEFARKITDVKNNYRRRTSINVKAKDGVSLEEVKDDVTGVLRAIRKIKPKSENNFALNSLSILSNIFDSVFSVLRLVGLIIGFLSMIVGMFSVANIMFVSVKERTNLIGIKKALGARRGVILLEFLTESVILCLIGGGLGLFFVWLFSYVTSMFVGFEIFLSAKNLMIGILASTLTGVVAGFVPAFIAALMDPVEAIRQ